MKRRSVLGCVDIHKEIYMPSEEQITELLTQNALAAELGMKPESLADWRHRGKGPRYVKLGQLVRYRRSDVEDWLDHQTVHP
jgi:predicted DNA-binding transcriptional regulator AlpA